MLVIFDCDGVLVDSETLASEAFSAQLQKLEIELKPEDCHRRFKGRTLQACFDLIEQDFEIKLPNNFRELLFKNTRALFEDRLEPIDGVQRVLDLLQEQNISFCVASNGAREKMKFSFERTQLTQYFSEELRFSAYECSEGKPSPELFLKAAEHVGVPAQFCWVIEDSLSGCRAAQTAGMNLIYFDSHEENVAEINSIPTQLRARSMTEVLQFFKARFSVE